MDILQSIEENFKINGKSIKFSKPLYDLGQIILNNTLSSNTNKKPIVIVKSRQVGITTLISALQLGISIFHEHSNTFRSGHMFPTLSIAAVFAKNCQKDLIFNAKSGTVKKRNGVPKTIVEEKIKWGAHCNRLFSKEFTTNSSIITDSVGLNGDRIRGRTFHFLVYDEAQCISQNAIDTTNYTTYNVMGQIVYIITPDNIDHISNELWKKSNRHYFNLNCIECNNYFPLYKTIYDIPDQAYYYNWEEILVRNDDVACPECQTIQNKNDSIARGKWINALDSGTLPFKGFHINQLLLNHLRKDNILATKERLNNKEWHNEILGDWF